MAVRPFDPATQRMPLKAILDHLFQTRWGTWVAIHVGQRIDPFLIRATRGRIRISFTAPTILLTHTGARSGTRRTTPLLYFTEGDKVVLIASKGGAPENPAWYHNVKAHPEVEASSDGRPERYVAREAEGDERERLWKLATKLYSGYEDYQARTNRRIPVIVLEPAQG
jgi:deazaflavin-dependent oxidoreductase (nitroreductase family)